MTLWEGKDVAPPGSTSDNKQKRHVCVTLPLTFTGMRFVFFYVLLTYTSIRIIFVCKRHVFLFFLSSFLSATCRAQAS